MGKKSKIRKKNKGESGVVQIRLVESDYWGATLEIELRGNRNWLHYSNLRVATGGTIHIDDGQDYASVPTGAGLRQVPR